MIFFEEREVHERTVIEEVEVPEIHYPGKLL